MCDTLLNQQKSLWPELSRGYEALGSVRVREIRCDGYSVYVQYNPRRITSTAAEVDPRSIGERRCFLCLDHLPAVQKGIQYRNEFLVLCNPVPIFERHLTITHRDHTPQVLEGNAQALLHLARDLSPEFTVFYNGPKCGASAPDHLHFQACPAGAIPVERDAADPAKRDPEHEADTVSMYTLRNIGRQVMVVEGADFSHLLKFFEKLLVAARKLAHSEVEPMVNVLSLYTDGLWRLIVFLRKKHRPEMYFKDGNERVMISPAAVDVGGLIITPIERDFERVNASMVQRMYDEVMLDEDSVKRIVALVRNGN